MSSIHFVGGEKGGVGKSVVARVLAQWLVDHEVPFAGIDGDLSHGALARYYGEFTHPVDLTSVEAADSILDRALGGERRVLVDLPAQSARALGAWLTGANVLGFAREVGVPITVWHVTDGGFASLAELEVALGLFGADAHHVVVRNYGRSKHFAGFDDSPARRTLEHVGGRILDIPELDAAAMYKIDRLGASFWAAINRSEGDVLGPLERQRVRLWLAQCYANVDALGGVV
jgi:hypothetical protein